MADLPGRRLPLRRKEQIEMLMATLVRVALFAIAVLPFQGHRLNEFTPVFFSGSVP